MSHMAFIDPDQRKSLALNNGSSTRTRVTPFATGAPVASDAALSNSPATCWTFATGPGVLPRKDWIVLVTLWTASGSWRKRSDASSRSAYAPYPAPVKSNPMMRMELTNRGTPKPEHHETIG